MVEVSEMRFNPYQRSDLKHATLRKFRNKT